MFRVDFLQYFPGKFPHPLILFLKLLEEASVKSKTNRNKINTPCPSVL